MVTKILNEKDADVYASWAFNNRMMEIPMDFRVTLSRSFGQTIFEIADVYGNVFLFRRT